MITRRLGLALALALLASSAVGQTASPVQTLPGLGTSANGNASSSIGVTNAFQSVWAAAPTASPRRGCTIQNNGTHTMWVEEGASAATANATKSQQLAAGAIFNCTTSGIALQGEIDITGTAADAFYAIQY